MPTTNPQVGYLDIGTYTACTIIYKSVLHTKVVKTVSLNVNLIFTYVLLLVITN